MRNVDKIFNEFRYVNMTIEAQEDNCFGTLVCNSGLEHKAEVGIRATKNKNEARKPIVE